MIRWDSFDIGSVEGYGDLAKAQGYHLRLSSFNTIEISSFPFEGVSMDKEVHGLLDTSLGNLVQSTAALCP